MNRKLVVMMMSVLALAVAGWFFSQQSKKDGMTTPAEAQDRIAADSTIVLLDVRTPSEFESSTGHLRGAVLIPVQELAERIEELDPYKDRPVIVYCRTQSRSAHAASFLTERGFSVTVMAGGITRWNSEERPVVHESPKGE
jgi:rhodanese-related sulfurtransferase